MQSIPQVKCRPMTARKLRGYTEDLPKIFYVYNVTPPRSIHGPSLYDKEPIKDSFWKDLGRKMYSLDGRQTKPQRLIFKSKSPSKPHRIRFIFELSSVTSGSVSPIILPELENKLYPFDGKFNYETDLISNATAVGFKASGDFSGTLSVLNIYPVYEDKLK